MDDSLQSIFKPPAEPGDEASDESRESRPKFGLSSSNQWYLVFVVACYALMEAWRSEHDVGLGSGFVVGQILTSGLLSALIGWIAFRLGGRSKLVGSVAFNGALTLVFFGQLVTYMPGMLNPPNHPDAEPTRRKSPREVSERLADIALEHGRETSEVTKEWTDSWTRMMADINFNFATKPDDAELKRRRALFVGHVRTMKKLLAFHDDTVAKLHRRSADLPRNEEVVRFHERVASDQKLFAAKFTPLWDDHLATAELLVSMTDLLIDNPQGWSVADDTVIFSDEALQNRYGALAEVFAPTIQRVDERVARFRESR